MKKRVVSVIPRREFIASVPAFLIGGRLLDVSGSWPADSQKQGEVSEVLTPEELKIVNGSVMARDLLNYYKQGYNCAESFFYVALKFMKKPRKLFWIASGFGGGLGRKDLCGFLTGGVMAIGLSVGKLKVSREEAKEIGENKVDEYWQWWANLAPYRCSGIKTEGRTSEVCKRVGRLAAARVEELIKGISSGS